MHSTYEEKKWVFHNDKNIFKEGIEEETYEKLYDFIEDLKQKYGPKNISMRCEKKTDYSRLEIIAKIKKPTLDGTFSP